MPTGIDDEVRVERLAAPLHRQLIAPVLLTVAKPSCRIEEPDPLVAKAEEMSDGLESTHAVVDSDEPPAGFNPDRQVQRKGDRSIPPANGDYSRSEYYAAAAVSRGPPRTTSGATLVSNFAKLVTNISTRRAA